jgi:serine/threonine protein kinase
MKKDPLIGQRLANFLVDRPLGRGGMAQVYYGIDSSLERPVAIKVIDARYQGDPEYARRFVDEAKLVARWRHENIVQVFYAGNDGDVYFFAMEYIDGLSLESLMERYLQEGSLMPHEDVLRIGRAVASALDYAHKQGVVHRDIKPSNIMISRDDRVVLMDFGLALDMGQGSMGQVFGTPHYISPEQARKSSDATAQSDIYSFAVVLYELLVGAIPFDDPSATSVAVQHMTQEPPPPTLINPALNYDVEKVLLKALSKAPQERYRSATAMLDALATAIATLKKPDSYSTKPLPPAAVSGGSPKVSRMSISEMLALDLEEDEVETAKSMRALNPIHRVETQETRVPAQNTRLSKQGQTREMKSPNITEAKPPVEAGSSRTGLLVALGAAVVVVLIVVLVMVLMNQGAETVDIAATENQQAALAAPGTQTSIAQTESSLDNLETPIPTTVVPTTVVPTTAVPTTAVAATSDSSGTGTAIVVTNESVNLGNTSVAATNVAVFASQTGEAANNALATDNAQLQATLTAQSVPTQASQATSPAFAGGLLIELTYNQSGFYLRNSSDSNIRLSNLSFRALDASGTSVGNQFDGVDWTRFYGNVDRNGRCVIIELLDQSSWTRPRNCEAAGGGQEFNSQLTFPTNDRRIFWDGRNGATQFAVSWNGTEAGRCAIADGFCSILVGR